MSALKSDPEFHNFLFDLDGTLTDSRPGIIRSIRAAVRAVGFETPPTENLMWCVGPPLPAIFAQLLARGENDPLVANAVDLYQEIYEATGVLENSLYDGVSHMLSALARAGKAHLVLVTTKRTMTADRVLRAFSIRDHFEAIFGGDTTGSRGKVDSVRLALQALSLEPYATAIVGDRGFDIAAGKQNRVFSIGVTYGYGTREELATAGADQICATPAEVLHFLNVPRSCAAR
jgi:phosphoglycolate phosphatase